ncbi:DsbA family protein [Acidovorax delafieldii]|jgi:putative protein-disulfide isomerase|uniref:DsbA family protein n=1 Tax=Acidovorax delafieldii TaxID=47920 RepID=UPI003757865C
MNAAASERHRLVFVGDPMCSWCYGFGQELSEALARRPEMQLDIVTGGLRAGATEVLDDAGKRLRLFHWAKVEAQTGLSFDREALLARRGFVYDTEPVCRAVVAARLSQPGANLLAIFRALQKAFYADGLDTTDPEVLVAVVTQALSVQALDAQGLQECFVADATLQVTQRDFAQARRWGITSFPALLGKHGEHLVRLVDGFAKAPVLLATIDRWMDQTSMTVTPRG